EGLDGTELAISESQERMAVVVEEKDVKRFRELAEEENLESTVVATVTENPYLTMHWKGNTVVNVSREFLNSNGAEKHITIETPKAQPFAKTVTGSFTENYKALAEDLNVCSRRGLSERFDSTIGAGTVLMPFGGATQTTPIQAMVNKVSVEHGDTRTVSFMSWGYNPFIFEKDMFHGAYLSVVESVAKLIAAGATFEDVYLTFQEYFLHPGQDPKRWGQPASALLGAYKAQTDLGIAAIGGKDSMSGSFEDLDVPPTLVSFAVTTDCICKVLTNEFKAPNHKVVLLAPEYDEYGIPQKDSLLKLFATMAKLNEEGKVLSAYTPTYGGIAEAVLKMGLGNKIGFRYASCLTPEELFGYKYGSFVVELPLDAELPDGARYLGKTIDWFDFVLDDELVCGRDLQKAYEDKLESVFHCNIKTEDTDVPTFTYVDDTVQKAKTVVARPKALIPVFPGTNCEYDTAKAFERAGAEPEVSVINNLSNEAIEKSVAEFARKIGESQIVFIPGGFSGGDEPDGSAKFIASFFRNPEIKDAVTDLLENRDGLMGGICNGFQALIKLGLVPYGKILDPEEDAPTLTFNTISRHQSKIARVRLDSNKGPWLKYATVGGVYNVPISHGEGRILASEEQLLKLAENGQILTQYVGLDGAPTMDIAANINGSVFAVEGLLSPDGHVFGKMGHSERIGDGLYKNVPGEYDMKLFESAVAYFKGE
ncbi:MAG: phosphoribosylformylglycinamidine synthase subunit PurQ, partial [Clostridia bacterium]|nr:phosphoribosylformylglycinamidine synthase subunit PurQ [Clostridia bacterium]